MRPGATGFPSRSSYMQVRAGAWSSAADGCCVTARPARRVRVGPPGLVTSAVTGSSWPGQLLGARPWRHPGRGLGHAGRRRRQPEGIVDGDAGRTAPVLQLSRPGASKLTILLQPCLSTIASGARPKFDPHPPDRPSLCYRSHVKAAACPAKPSSVSQRPVRLSSTTRPAARRAGLLLVLVSSAIGQLERSAANCQRNVWPWSSGR
jgi:hypothetical protein